MLFYPFEEQFYFPAIFIEQSNLMGLKIKVVGYKLEGSFCFFIIVLDFPEFIRVVL
jgi:hypothetical protein